MTVLVTILKAAAIICCTPLAFFAWVIACLAAARVGPGLVMVAAVGPVLAVSWWLHYRRRRRR
jgi:hypothetical protein